MLCGTSQVAYMSDLMHQAGSEPMIIAWLIGDII
jgi:hypothetical protein